MAAEAQADEWLELLMPLVHSRWGSLTEATTRPPGHMQKEWAAAASAVARDTRL